jgi:hypothetical protein
MSRQEIQIVPREYSAALRGSPREYTASVSDGFVEEPDVGSTDLEITFDSGFA